MVEPSAPTSVNAVLLTDLSGYPVEYAAPPSARCSRRRVTSSCFSCGWTCWLTAAAPKVVLPHEVTSPGKLTGEEADWRVTRLQSVQWWAALLQFSLEQTTAVLLGSYKVM